MTPQFSLVFSNDGIALLRRAGPAWEPVGAADLNDDDISSELEHLRMLAGPGSEKVKLVLPNEQIRYLHLPPEQSSDDAVRAALEGATPCAVDELKYDFETDAAGTHVAAVAADTLREAEEFAREQGFHGLCFAAIPPDDSFEREVFFGLTVEGRVLSPGLGPDDTPVRIAADVPAPQPEDPGEDGAAQDDPAQPEPTNDENAAAALFPKIASPAPERSVDVADAGPNAASLFAASSNDLPPEPDAAEEALAAPVLPFASRMPKPSPEYGPSGESTEDVVRFWSRARPTLSEDGTEPPAFPELPSDSSGQRLFAHAPQRLTPDVGAKPARAAKRTAGRLPALQGALRPGVADPTSETEDAALAAAASLNAPSEQPRSAPWRVPALLAAVLVALLGLAAVFLMPSDDPETTVVARTGSSVTVVDEPSSDPVDPSEPAPLPAQEPAPNLALTSEPEPVTEPEPTPEPEPRVVPAPATTPTILTSDEAERRYAATGVWQKAPPTPQAPGTSGRAAPTQLSEPAALPREAPKVAAAPEADGPIAKPAEPPAPQSRFSLDARGFVVATPSGAMTPSGAIVYAGAPPLSPPTRPGTTAPTSAEIAASDTGVSAPVTPPPERPESLSVGPTQNTPSEDSGPGLNAANLDLAGVRPQARPEGAIQPAAPGAPAALPYDGPSPRLRPEGLAPERAPEPEPEPAEDQDARAPASADPFEGATQLAIATSARPHTRPRNFARTVERARAAQPSTPVAATVRTVRPSAPTSGSVAANATQSNVLNLRRTALIGVYGSQSDRRAHVRLANGRIVTVRPGDRLDGGRVASIGTSELVYSKGGRNVRLSMPR